MSGHTAGPWFCGQDGFNLGNGVVYARHPGGNPKDIATIRGWGDEQKSNSALIGAAPDLLEALENLENDAGQIPEHAWLLVKAAIAKAKGLTSS